MIAAEYAEDSPEELDLLSSATSTLVASGSATPAGSSADVTWDADLGKRALRKRANKDTSLSTKDTKLATKKRKRTVSLTRGQNDIAANEKAGKKSKLEDRKLVGLYFWYLR